MKLVLIFTILLISFSSYSTDAQAEFEKLRFQEVCISEFSRNWKEVDQHRPGTRPSDLKDDGKFEKMVRFSSEEHCQCFAANLLKINQSEPVGKLRSPFIEATDFILGVKNKEFGRPFTGIENRLPVPLILVAQGCGLSFPNLPLRWWLK